MRSKPLSLLSFCRPCRQVLSSRDTLFSMKTALLSVALAFSLVAAEPPSKPDKDVVAAIDMWKQALLKRDGAALQKFYHDDLVYEHSSGKTENKAEAIEAVVKAQPAPYVSIDFRDPRIRVYGNTAIIKSVLDINTSEAKNHLDVLMVLVKSGGNWQLVARQAIKLP